jgi:hypothetical protein
MGPTCPGCVGRGIGTRCSMCGGVVPAEKRRTPLSRSEVRPDCLDCRAGRTHTHR